MARHRFVRRLLPAGLTNRQALILLAVFALPGGLVLAAALSAHYARRNRSL